MKILNNILKVVKKIKLRTLISLILIFSFTSYAWMIYNTRVSTGINAHISSWDFDFSVGDNNIEKDIVLDIDQIYPGMKDATKTVVVKNNGEIPGELSYEVKKIVILGTKYEVSDFFTSDMMNNIMKESFPFKLSVEVENSTPETSNILPINETKNVIIAVSWPFESGNDELDARWGEDAYDYYLNYPEDSSIHLEITLKVIQKENK